MIGPAAKPRPSSGFLRSNPPYYLKIQNQDFGLPLLKHRKLDDERSPCAKTRFPVVLAPDLGA